MCDMQVGAASDKFVRLWLHEGYRVFGDCMHTAAAKQFLIGQLQTLTHEVFHRDIHRLLAHLDEYVNGIHGRMVVSGRDLVGYSRIFVVVFLSVGPQRWGQSSPHGCGV